MKIVELQIYGYGQLENVFIHNLNDLQVFFGENEAGKSTIMAFIHGILFGFPTKQQSAELRYEPKNSAKYGGKITILHDTYRQVVIERIKGKAAGDVKVVLEDGTVGGEDLLRELLSFFDRSLFQAIFSFNLQGLQNIHQMKGEELGKFLFSAGTLGTDRLVLTETALQKEIDLRFKPGGRKPVLNEKLHELHELSGDLKKAAAKNKEYEVLTEKKDQLQRELAQIDKSLKEIQEHAEKLKEWKKIHLLVKEEQLLKKEISELGEIHFPVRGIDRLEQLKQLLHPCNAQVLSITERIATLEKELASLKPNLELLENEGALTAIIEQFPLQEQWRIEKNQCEIKIKECEDRLATIKEKLHLPLQDKEITMINTNIYMKDRVEKISRKTIKLQEVKEELDERFQEEKCTLEELEKEICNAEGQILPELERKKTEEQLYAGNDKRNLEIEWEAIKDKIIFYQHAREQEKKNKKQKQQQFLILIMILIGVSIYGVFTKEWVLVLLGALGSIVIAFYITQGSSTTDKGRMQTLNGLKEREKELLRKLQDANFQNFAVLENQIQLDDRHLEHLRFLKIKLEQQQTQYDKVISQFEAWELESVQHKHSLLDISKELRIPMDIATSYLLEAFQLLEQHKAVGREKKQILDRLEQIKLEEKKLADALENYSAPFIPEQGISLQRKVFLLRSRLKEEEEKQIKWQEKQLKLAEFTADLEQKKLEKKHLQSEIQKLFMDAGTADEEQFYELGNKADKHKKLLERFKDITKHLQFSPLSEIERVGLLQYSHFEEDLLESSSQIQSLHERMIKVQEELAMIKHEINVLEEGGVFTELLHQFKQKKFEFAVAAKEWATFTLAQDVLSKTIERYKDSYLPRMLVKAEEYLFFLTDGNYHKIHLRESGTGFLIERKDYTIFEANELSQATTEQVYVSIRFALATTLYEKYHFPIIIDDSFVNFDEKRTRKVIELLKSIEGNQILFFTCHAHLLNYFQKENILSLEKGALKILS